jgi:hypothetical protein
MSISLSIEPKIMVNLHRQFQQHVLGLGRNRGEGRTGNRRSLIPKLVRRMLFDMWALTISSQIFNGS